MENLVIRKAVPEDAGQLCQLHIQSIRVICSPFYEPAAIDAWTRDKQPDSYVVAMQRQQHMLVAVNPLCERQIIGFSGISLADARVRAVYVEPDFIGKAVGRCLMVQLEQVAMASGLQQLSLNASLNAEGFYRKLGYEASEKSINMLRNGVEIDCVSMHKKLLGVIPIT